MHGPLNAKFERIVGPTIYMYLVWNFPHGFSCLYFVQLFPWIAYISEFVW